MALNRGGQSTAHRPSVYRPTSKPQYIVQYYICMDIYYFYANIKQLLAMINPEHGTTSAIENNAIENNAIENNAIDMKYVS